MYVNSQLRQLTRSDGSSYVAPRAFLDMYNAIWEAENFIYITGWSVNVNIRLVRTDEKSHDERDYSLTVGQLLKKKVRQNWDPHQLLYIFETINFIAGVRGGASSNVGMEWETQHRDKVWSLLFCLAYYNQ